MVDSSGRDGWVTRFGLVMAMAGNAVGLGNFLRFPGVAAPYGGAFMVPYFIALVLLGVPLMWMEWTIGRHGGGYGHGSAPGQLHRLWSHWISRYVGIFGILLPACIGLYYIYIESWSLGYAWQTMTGEYWGQTSRPAMKEVFVGYLGLGNETFAFSVEGYVFFLITFTLNMIVFSRGISKGIELLCRFAMPLLLLFGIILAIRVMTLPPVEGRSVGDGLARLWAIDWSVLKSAKVWIAASGQVFFTLSLGLGMIHSYASYLKRHDDIVLSGLATCGTNEFAEVIVGSSIAIPAAVVFFGPLQLDQIVAGGTFDIGFQTLPVVFQEMPAGQVFGTIWFLLLFLAGMTSSVAMFTPLLLFLQDELRLRRRVAVACIIGGVFLLTQPVILFMHHGIIDEIDYWVGQVFLVTFAALEAVIFAWIFGLDKGWKEMHRGADLQVPRIFFYIMKYVTPAYALALLGWWILDEMWGKLTMADVPAENQPFLWLGRAIILGVFLFLAAGVKYAWSKYPEAFNGEPTR